MNDYVKLSTSLKERVIFFFTGLIKKSHIISKTVEPITYSGVKEEIVIPEVTDMDHMLNHISFFDLDKSEVKSNL